MTPASRIAAQIRKPVRSAWPMVVGLGGASLERWPGVEVSHRIGELGEVAPGAVVVLLLSDDLPFDLDGWRRAEAAGCLVLAVPAESGEWRMRWRESGEPSLFPMLDSSDWAGVREDPRMRALMAELIVTQVERWLGARYGLAVT